MAAVVGAALVASAVVTAQPAMASDLSWTFSDGAISYRDSTNKFCVRAYDSEGARKVTVTATGGGRSWSLTDQNDHYDHPGGTCISLNGHAENTSVTLTAKSYWGERGTWVGRGSRTITT
ncbi:hypothetical protein [Nonomuraea gerenzanensis]|uniref:Secreted protein n=1 Tax=Nonomuraea gerenzanensis TaxID=93944 RepID=A0A1M4E0E5_9ACTN|nr:hypothetical protein [Nonomuraea gerenzanensis]UBU14569.1 hypothetical protein LCN96_05955 [Nonomuraea gerenzanensis]SBO92285.1 hypothetical protein BN4615_P1799 [Nonomuraea gerenzanensis]